MDINPTPTQIQTSFGTDDTRTQRRIRLVNTPSISDKFTDYTVVESEARTILAGYLFLLLIIFAISMVV